MLAGGSKCVLADDRCEGRLEWHHVISRSRLKRRFPRGAWKAQSGAFKQQRLWWPISRTYPPHESDPTLSLDDILGDTRNRVWACSHHHELITNHRVYPDIPESVWEFADEFGLRGMLENDIARRAADG